MSAANPRYQWYRHCTLLADTLERVVRRDIRRLIISMPPQHGKSELVSRSLPGYELTRNPHSNVILVSYGADLAHELSVDARDRFESVGGRLRRDVRSVKRWRTAEGGGVRAVGVRGSLTGHPADLIIVDDPHKNEEDASNARAQEKMKSWWDSTLVTRLAEDGALIIMCTRWDLRDLVGMVLEREETERPENWTVLSLPAITDGEETEWPETCSVVPDFREEEGVPLCPEIRSLDYLEGIKTRSLSFYWNAIWQQRPTDPAGSLFRREWLDAVPLVSLEDIPEGSRWVWGWDRAGTDRAGDWTVGVLMARSPDGIYYIAEVIRGQWDPLEVERAITGAVQRTDIINGRGAYGPRVEIVQEQEPGSSGKAVASMSIRGLEGFPAFAIRPDTGKVSRARPVATYMASGHVRMVRGPWNEEYRRELLQFRDKSSQADQVDATSLAFLHLALSAGDPLHPHRGKE